MILVALVVYAALALATPIKRATAYFSPSSGGGSMLDVAGVGVGEPLNVQTSSRIYSSCIK